MKNISNSLLLLACTITLFQTTGCGVAAKVLLGVDTTPSWESEEEIKKGFDRYEIPESQRFVADTAGYSNAVLADFNMQMEELRAGEVLDSIKIKDLKKSTKDNLQPEQVRYFDSNGNPLFKLVNCYVDPPIPMSWNVNGCFDSFPPATADEMLTKGNKDIGFFLNYIKTIDGKNVSFENLPKSDYYAVVFWNEFMKRPSKKLIKQLKSYDKEHPGQTTFFLFVNNQNHFIWDNLDAKSKQDVIDQINKQKTK